MTLAAPTGDARTVGNPVLLRQAISNLVRNAVRHNLPGGFAAVRLSSTEAGARITVVNTGAVIDQETADAFAEPFTRGTGRSLTRGSGHGLGLSIVAAVVEAHEGALALVPNPDGGLTVQVDLRG